MPYSISKITGVSFHNDGANQSYIPILVSLQKGLPLLVECPLIFHPVPELRDTPNLLPIIVRNWVGHGLT